MPAIFPRLRRTVPRRLGPSALLLFACLQAAAVRTPSPPPPSAQPPPPPILPPPFTCCSGQASCGRAFNDNVTCAALGDIYTATNGVGWSDQTGWSAAAAGSPTDFCTSFHYAACTGGFITTLYVHSGLGMRMCLTSFASLLGWNLSGTLPSSLSSLTTLTDLLIVGNPYLTGSIPSGLGSLSNLVNLHLDHNSLSGTVPSTLGSLTSLTALFFANNILSSTLPASLSSLTGMINLCVRVCPLLSIAHSQTAVIC